jgi:hypothetical protein
VLSLPHRLRYLLAWDHDLCRAVTGVFVRAVLGSLRRRARRVGAPHGRGGAVAILQRFGAALNLNVHVHALVLDGVYVEDGPGRLRFHALPAPLDEEMDAVLLTVARRLERLLARRGLVGADDERDDHWREEAPVLAGIAAASVQGRRALGERAGAAVVRVDASGGAPVDGEPGLGPCHARWDGYDLHAAVVVPAHDRARLERVCRYALRPPVAHDRLLLTSEGRIMLDLRHRWSDGTTHLIFDPLELLERLAALHPTAQGTRGGDPRVDAAAADQSALLLRRAGGPSGVARAARAVRCRIFHVVGRHGRSRRASACDTRSPP